jgi:hypothetical protein
MIVEDTFVNADEWDLPDCRLICVDRYVPMDIKFAYVAPELAPSLSLIKSYQETATKRQAIAHTMRAWGRTLDEKNAMAKYVAYTDILGTDARIYRRAVYNNPAAQKAMQYIRDAHDQGFTVVLMSHERFVPHHRLILLQILLRSRTLEALLKKRKYPREALRFAARLQGRYIRQTTRVI